MTLLIKNMNMKRGKKRVIRQLNLLVESGEVAALIAERIWQNNFAEWHCPTAANNL